MKRDPFGYYVLVIALDKAQDIHVGALGRLRFGCGFYAYAGSAKNGLRQRVGRHLSVDKKMRWHVDYLLERGRVTDVIMFDISGNGGESVLRTGLTDIIMNAGRGDLARTRVRLDAVPTECLIARALCTRTGASIPVARFGASDCRCPGHLVFLGKTINR